MSAAKPIEAGDLYVVLRCPKCGERADVFVHLGVVLKVTEDAAQLRPSLKAKAVEHQCGQIRLEERATEAEPKEQRPLDWAERAAGEGVRHA